jgi:hypothetical protein
MQYIKSSIIGQAIELGFDFSEIVNSVEMWELSEMLEEFFKDNICLLEREEDKCEVRCTNREQHVSYGDYDCTGEIVDFSQHWRKPVGTKVFHSDFITEHCGRMVHMHLYYEVEETEYNAPEGMEWCPVEKKHIRSFDFYSTVKLVSVLPEDNHLAKEDGLWAVYEYTEPDDDDNEDEFHDCLDCVTRQLPTESFRAFLLRYYQWLALYKEEVAKKVRADLANVEI